MADLRARVLTSIAVLALVSIPLSLGGLWATLFVALIGGVMGWEYRRMTRLPAGPIDHLAYGFAVAAAASAGFDAPAAALGVLAVSALAFFLRDLDRGAPPGWGPVGMVTIGLAAACFATLRADPGHGVEIALWIAVVVVATDVGAFFVGRMVGGPLLWPRVSPKKTWAGLGGGVGLAAGCGVAFALFADGAAPAPTAVVSALAAIVAQGGDLAESALKRRFGVKDSGGWLPGHGGALDRLDGFCAVSLATAAATFAKGSPVFAW